MQSEVAANPDECSGVNPKPGEYFQVVVSVAAAEASPDTALSEVVVDECGNSGG